MHNQDNESKFAEDTKLALALSLAEQQQIVNEQFIKETSRLEYENQILKKKLENTEKHVQFHAARLSRIETLLAEIKKVEKGTQNLSQIPPETLGMDSDAVRSIKDHITDEIAKVKILLGEDKPSQASLRFGQLLSTVNDRLPLFDIQLGQFSFANEESAMRVGYGDYNAGIRFDNN